MVHGRLAVGAVFMWGVLAGCKSEAPPPAGAPGGQFKPGERAIQRAVPYLFTLIRLEERDRVFKLISYSYEPVLDALKQLDDARNRLIDALTQTAHTDLASVLTQKRLTSLPDAVEVIVGPPNVLEYKMEGETALVRFDMPLPDGVSKQAWAQLRRDPNASGWRIDLPFAESPGGTGVGPSGEQVRAEVDKAARDMKALMSELADRLEAGEMMDSAPIRRKLTEAGRPLAAAIQRMIYGRSNIR